MPQSQSSKRDDLFFVIVILSVSLAAFVSLLSEYQSEVPHQKSVTLEFPASTKFAKIVLAGPYTRDNGEIDDIADLPMNSVCENVNSNESFTCLWQRDTDPVPVMDYLEANVSHDGVMVWSFDFETKTLTPTHYWLLFYNFWPLVGMLLSFVCAAGLLYVHFQPSSKQTS